VEGAQFTGNDSQKFDKDVQDKRKGSSLFNCSFLFIQVYVGLLIGTYG
jgi:hypothetical protein